MTTRPIKFRWEGGAMVPLVPRAAHELYTEGESYLLAPWEPRSGASHRHFHAALNEGWQNLPERAAARFPSPEHLRKFLMIRTGYYHEHTAVYDTPADAERAAAIARPLDEFAVVSVEGRTVKVFTAKSSSARSMTKAEFQKAKSDVLDALAEMIGVDRTDLDKNAGRAA